MVIIIDFAKIEKDAIGGEEIKGKKAQIRLLAARGL